MVSLDVDTIIKDLLGGYGKLTTKPFLKWHKNRRVRGAKRNEALIKVVTDMDDELEHMLEDDPDLVEARQQLIEYFTTSGGKFQDFVFRITSILSGSFFFIEKRHIYSLWFIDLLVTQRRIIWKNEKCGYN